MAKVSGGAGGSAPAYANRQLGPLRGGLTRSKGSGTPPPPRNTLQLGRSSKSGSMLESAKR